MEGGVGRLERDTESVNAYRGVCAWTAAVSIVLASKPWLPCCCWAVLSLFFGVPAVRRALASDDLRAEDDDDDEDEVDDAEEEPFLTALRCSGILVCRCFLGGAEAGGSVMMEWEGWM